MTLTQCIHHVPHTWHNEPIQWHLIQRTQMKPRHEKNNNKLSQALVPATGQKKCTHQWRLTGARPKMIQERAVRCSDTLHRRPGPHGTSNWTLPLQERTQTSIWETHDAPRNEQAHAPHTRGVSPFPASLFHPFHFHNMSTGALYNK